MVKEELAKCALSFVTIPSHFRLFIEDYRKKEAHFVWIDAESDQGISITLDNEGKLTYLSNEFITVPSTEILDFEQRKEMAEHFLRQQYADALDYLSYSYANEKESSTRFFYEQFVEGLPLESYYCIIEVHQSGEVFFFHYKGYTESLPVMPLELIGKEKILVKSLASSNWQLKLEYLSSAVCEVENDGLYMVYENRELLKQFDTRTGEANFKDEVEKYPASYEPFPNVKGSVTSVKLEEIIGIPSTMELLREVDQGDEIGLVWRDKDWQSPNDRSLESFLLERVEDTVKATIFKKSNRLKSFIWFKERTGSLQLSFEQCKEVAISFVGNYFSAFIPFLQIANEQESFNETNKAFFTFPLHDGNGLMIEGEFFHLAVNRTTGLIDLLMSPSITIELLEQLQNKPILPPDRLVKSVKQIDACLFWSAEYDDQNQPCEQLKYKLCERSTKRSIKGIDAWTGALICKKI